MSYVKTVITVCWNACAFLCVNTKMSRLSCARDKDAVYHLLIQAFKGLTSSTPIEGGQWMTVCFIVISCQQFTHHTMAPQSRLPFPSQRHDKCFLPPSLVFSPYLTWPSVAWLNKLFIKKNSLLFIKMLLCNVWAWLTRGLTSFPRSLVCFQKGKWKGLLCLCSVLQRFMCFCDAPVLHLWCVFYSRQPRCWA